MIVTCFLTAKGTSPSEGSEGTGDELQTGVEQRRNKKRRSLRGGKGGGRQQEMTMPHINIPTDCDMNTSLLGKYYKHLIIRNMTKHRFVRVVCIILIG